MKRRPSDATATDERMALLCALHYGPAALQAEGLEIRHFETNARKEVFRLICEDAATRSDGRPDHCAILGAIATQCADEFEEISAELTPTFMPDPAHTADYARGVLQGHARRECTAAAETIQEALHTGSDPTHAFTRLQRYYPLATGTATRRPDWHTAFQKSLMDADTFTAQDVPERPALLHSFFREGDTGLIFAARGVGKTWIAMLIARAVAAGASLGEWEAGTAGPRRVCYVDGEVNLPDSMERAQLLKMSSNVLWLHHETISGITGRPLNLAAPEQQRALLELLIIQRISVLFLDNLSCLMRGVGENEADDWEIILDWLLELRRAGISVVLIHHAGRNGQLRGTSRREDSVHWILKLEDAADEDSKGAAFRTTFTKNRNSRGGAASCPPLLWQMETEATPEGSRLNVKCERSSDTDALVELVNAGFTSASRIAAELEVTAGTISKWAKKASDAGRIRIEGRQYLPAA